MTTTATSPSTLDAWLENLSAQAYRKAVLASVPEMAGWLQELLGQRIVAFMTGVDDPKAVGRWARGERSPRGDAEQRLRAAYHVAQLIADAESAETARAWFIGMNPYLGDRAPFAILGEEPAQAPTVLAAAKAFAAGN